MRVSPLIAPDLDLCTEELAAEAGHAGREGAARVLAGAKTGRYPGAQREAPPPGIPGAAVPKGGTSDYRSGNAGVAFDLEPAAAKGTGEHGRWWHFVRVGTKFDFDVRHRRIWS